MIIAFPFVLFFSLHLIFPLDIDISYSKTVLDKDGNVLQSYLTYDDKWRLYTELNEISPMLKKAIIAKEDKYFYYHPGINPFAMSRALFNNVVRHKRTSGASTITMQVARMLQPKKRTYWHKLVEIFRALQLEMMYSKAEILQMYLNLVPYGGNIEGVKSASLFYFQKNPDHLSLAEVTALAIIPNRPSSLRMGPKNEEIQKARNKWLRTFAKEKIFSQKAIDEAIAEPLEARRTVSPKKAQQFCRRMRKAFPNQALIKTTLDPQKQSQVEEITRNYVERLVNHNIHNAAVIVLDTKTGNVVAYVGSADYNNKFDGGQVDGIKAIRQPGSTLKPLIYGLAFDKGIVTPQTIITDVPVNFNGYRPDNFDRKFNGYVTAEYCLMNSLNIPAVKMLHKLTPDTLAECMIKLGFPQIKKDRKHLGLSMALGGCGVSLDDLTCMYASFARYGTWMPINWLKGNSNPQRVQVMSPAAAFMVTDILVKKTRPDLPIGYENSYHLPKIAWKTGTSYGRRDAWSIGYNKRFTIGVWVGNFSGEGVPELTGTDIATPLLFNIFNTLDYNSNNDWYSMPKGLDFRYVCSESGKRPNTFCGNQVMDYYIPMVSDNSVCEHMKNIYVSANDSFTYCNMCLPYAGYKERLVRNHPPEMIDYFERHMINYERIPPHNPNCEKVFQTGAPDITSPGNGMDYLLDKNDKQSLMLACNAAADVKKVFWYVNNHFLRVAARNEKIFIQPDPGKVKISCSDDKGRNTDVVITVKYVEM